MTAYRVVYTEQFQRQIEVHIDYLLGKGAAPYFIANWYDRLIELLDRLNEWPTRLPVDELQSSPGCEVRKLNYGDYLVFFEVDDHLKQVNLNVFVHGAKNRKPKL